MGGMATLAQASPPTGQVDAGRVLVIIGLVVVVVTLAGIGILWFRRRVLAPPPGTGEMSQGFLDELRAMRDRGEMSHEEYEAARRSMREKLRATLHADQARDAEKRTAASTGVPKNEARRAQRPDNDA